MKKIFAIALALVMVFAMTSAFAMNCLTFDWSKTTNCGMGKVEVVPYIKCNGALPGQNVYNVSDCAAAVNTEEVFFAVKVIVDENPNASWWANAELVLSHKGLTSFTGKATGLDTRLLTASGTTSLKAGEYYYLPDGSMVKAANFVANAANLFVQPVTDATAAKACVDLVSTEYLQYGYANALELNGYRVYTTAADAADKDFEIVFDDVEVQVVDGKVTNVKLASGNVYSSFCATYYVGKDNAGKNITADASCGTDYATINDIFTKFGLSFGMKLTGGDVVGVLGWKSEVSDCATWGAKSCAVVDAECVVAIPKTGDASVLAWLF